MQDEGIKIVTVRIPMPLYRKLRDQAAGKSINATIVSMLQAKLLEEKNPQ